MDDFDRLGYVYLWLSSQKDPGRQPINGQWWEV